MVELEKLPLKIRKDLSFDECFVCEVVIGKRKVFFSVCDRSPNTKADTPEFENLLADFENLYRNISKTKPYACFFAGDFNAHSPNWWPNGDPNAEGFALDNIFPLLI